MTIGRTNAQSTGGNTSLEVVDARGYLSQSEPTGFTTESSKYPIKAAVLSGSTQSQGVHTIIGGVDIWHEPGQIQAETYSTTAKILVGDPLKALYADWATVLTNSGLNKLPDGTYYLRLHQIGGRPAYNNTASVQDGAYFDVVNGVFTHRTDMAYGIYVCNVTTQTTAYFKILGIEMASSPNVNRPISKYKDSGYSAGKYMGVSYNNSTITATAVIEGTQYNFSGTLWRDVYGGGYFPDTKMIRPYLESGTTRIALMDESHARIWTTGGISTLREVPCEILSQSPSFLMEDLVNFNYAGL